MPKAERTRRSLGPLGWVLIAGALVYAVAAFGSGFDRLSKSAGQAERLVPGPLRGEAEIAAARQAIVDGNPALALAHARAATVAMPVASEGPALMGSAFLLMRDYARADAAFRAAAAGGWRDVSTQVYWAEQSAAGGDWDLAAARIDAVLRAKPELPGADGLRAPFETQADGRAALARKLAEQPVWLAPYLLANARSSDATLVGRASVVAAAARYGPRFGCDRVRAFTVYLLERGATGSARSVWDAHCPQGRVAEGIADPDFAQASLDRREPFGWTLQPQGDLVLDLAGTGKARALIARTDAGAARLVATQVLADDTGGLAVAWEARDEGGKTSRRVDVSIDCGGQPQRPDFAATDRRAFAAQPCDSPLLGIWIKPGSGEVAIDRVYRVIN